MKCVMQMSVLTTMIMSMMTQMIVCPNDATNDDHNVYLAILMAVQGCQPLTTLFYHVRGHQDKGPKCQLTTTEIFNIECDKKAKQYAILAKLASMTYGDPKIPEAQPHLQTNSKIICRQYLPTLHHATTTPELHTFRSVSPGLTTTSRMYIA